MNSSMKLKTKYYGVVAIDEDGCEFFVEDGLCETKEDAQQILEDEAEWFRDSYYATVALRIVSLTVEELDEQRVNPAEDSPVGG